jgi:uncharacterized protein (DUF1015 family)
VPSSTADSPHPAATGLEVRPFRALTYRQRDPGHLARVSSPAYDLVTPEGRERLAATDPHNIVRLILPRVVPEPGTSGADALRASVEQAARTLRSWEHDRVLVRDPEPALWVYAMSPPDGTPATVGWVAAVAIPAPGSRAVLPHEDTYPVAVEGRRALLAATGTDLEPIVLAHDPDPEVTRLTAVAQDGEPTLTVTDADGVRHDLWRVTRSGDLDRLTAALSRTGAVIADGHHRFAAARAHARTPAAGAAPPAILALVTPMGPGGLRVQPIHRVVPGLDLDDALRAAAPGFRVTELAVDDGPAALRGAVARWLTDPVAAGFLLSDGRRLAQLDGPAPVVTAAVPQDAPAAWRRLDVVLAHHGLFQRLWGRSDEPESVLVAHSVDAALATARTRDGVAVLLRPSSPTDVAAVARAGSRMPRKSTLFVPKPRTGLLLRPHAD